MNCENEKGIEKEREETDDMFLKDMIDRCNDVLLKRAYPNCEIIGTVQHRDLVLTFFAGVVEVLFAFHQTKLLVSLKPLLDKMSNPNWSPGVEFILQQPVGSKPN